MTLQQTKNFKRLRKLSTNQENFCKFLIEGKTQRDAYLNAFPSSRTWKSESVDRAATEELHKEHVKQHYIRLKKESGKIEKEDVLWSQQDSVMILKDLIAIAREKLQEKGKYTMTDVNAIVMGVRELNNIHGYNSTNIQTSQRVVIVGSQADLKD